MRKHGELSDYRRRRQCHVGRKWAATDSNSEPLRRAACVCQPSEAQTAGRQPSWVQEEFHLEASRAVSPTSALKRHHQPVWALKMAHLQTQPLINYCFSQRKALPSTMRFDPPVAIFSFRCKLSLAIAFNSLVIYITCAVIAEHTVEM